MKSTSLRRAVAPGIAALALLAVTGCGAANEDTGSGNGGDESSGGTSEAVDLGEGTLAGGGASTQQAAMAAWAVGFQEMNPGMTIEYDPVGSGGGRESFISSAYPFAGSDAYLTDEESELSAAKERCGGTDPIEIPSYVSPIALVYTLEGVDELNLTPEAIAGIFSGEITKWNDPAIADANPDADLPDTNINPVHRSDESGTTENFTTYLDAVAGDVWTAGVVETWPGDFGGEGAKGTSGVVQAAGSEGSIGYADASQAGELSVANVAVGEEFVAPSPEAAAQILEVSPKAEGAAENQLIFDLDHNTEESGTYPVVLTSYLLACEKYEDADQAAQVKAFLSYVVSDEGQEMAASEAGSAPLSDNLQEQAQTIIEKIS